VLTEEKLDEINDKHKHSLRKSFRHLAQETKVSDFKSPVSNLLWFRKRTLTGVCEQFTELQGICE
jgi:hypothetical protein